LKNVVKVAKYKKHGFFLTGCGIIWSLGGILWILISGINLEIVSLVLTLFPFFMAVLNFFIVKSIFFGNPKSIRTIFSLEAGNMILYTLSFLFGLMLLTPGGAGDQCGGGELFIKYSDPSFFNKKEIVEIISENYPNQTISENMIKDLNTRNTTVIEFYLPGDIESIKEFEKLFENKDGIEQIGQFGQWCV